MVAQDAVESIILGVVCCIVVCVYLVIYGRTIVHYIRAQVLHELFYRIRNRKRISNQGESAEDRYFRQMCEEVKLCKGASLLSHLSIIILPAKTIHTLLVNDGNLIPLLLWSAFAMFCMLIPKSSKLRKCAAAHGGAMFLLVTLSIFFWSDSGGATQAAPAHATATILAGLLCCDAWYALIGHTFFSAVHAWRMTSDGVLLQSALLAEAVRNILCVAIVSFVQPDVQDLAQAKKKLSELECHTEATDCLLSALCDALVTLDGTRIEGPVEKLACMLFGSKSSTFSALHKAPFENVLADDDRPRFAAFVASSQTAGKRCAARALHVHLQDTFGVLFPVELVLTTLPPKPHLPPESQRVMHMVCVKQDPGHSNVSGRDFHRVGNTGTLDPTLRQLQLDLQPCMSVSPIVAAEQLQTMKPSARNEELLKALSKHSESIDDALSCSSSNRSSESNWEFDENGAAKIMMLVDAFAEDAPILEVRLVFPRSERKVALANLVGSYNSFSTWFQHAVNERFSSSDVVPFSRNVQFVLPGLPASNFRARACNLAEVMDGNSLAEEEGEGDGRHDDGVYAMLEFQGLSLNQGRNKKRNKRSTSKVARLGSTELQPISEGPQTDSATMTL
eukprot:TRINITY_DN23516_c0_g1_i1.p1 TRINITY_DN23516_c0_g1~~TRINITY_DN23516_c0_g1_i1.p1  ORF type:complete len:635 (+),score=91.18 TRINITY_DN23516_c0_g1_i1:51-1907(+)